MKKQALTVISFYFFNQNRQSVKKKNDTIPIAASPTI